MTEIRQVCEFEFSIVGMLRFVSHLELQNYLSRLLVRAGIQVRFTEGFNPRPRISLPVPRNVGIASLHDRGRFDVDEGFDVNAMMEKFKGVVPFEMKLHRAWVIPANRLERVKAVEWRIDLEDINPEAMASRIEKILSGQCLVTRKSKKQDREITVDLRPMILEMALEDQSVRAKIAYSPEGSVKPGELLDLLGLDRTVFLQKMTRVTTCWSGT
jgi:radical SAM-linked protein